MSGYVSCDSPSYSPSESSDEVQDDADVQEEEEEEAAIQVQEAVAVQEQEGQQEEENLHEREQEEDSEDTEEGGDEGGVSQGPLGTDNNQTVVEEGFGHPGDTSATRQAVEGTEEDVHGAEDGGVPNSAAGPSETTPSEENPSLNPYLNTVHHSNLCVERACFSGGLRHRLAAAAANRARLLLELSVRACV